MSYCSVDDLLTGEMQFSSTVDKAVFVQDAADEIDAALGVVYDVPLTGLADWATKLVKGINVKLATGRLILSVAAGDDTLNPYAQSLINDAKGVLEQIRTGCIDLEGATRRDTTQTAPHGPKIVNGDALSAVDAFEQFAMRDRPCTLYPPGWHGWRPGN